MQETRKALIKDEWVVCSKCGHKLGKVIEGQLPKGIEIKCHSCKEINIVNKPRKYTVKASKSARQYKYYKENYKEVVICKKH